MMINSILLFFSTIVLAIGVVGGDVMLTSCGAVATFTGFALRILAIKSDKKEGDGQL